MESPTLKIISDSFIKPQHSSEEAKNPTYFSPWDLLMISVNYIQKGLLYPLPENQDFSITTFLHRLKLSLSATLTHFHPLAARLATVKQETDDPSFVMFVNPENSPGARFIHSSVDLTVAKLLIPADVPVVVQSFFDHHQAIDHDGHELSLLTVQVTELIDGIFIGCSINHMLVDGSSFWHFFNSWSEVFRSMSQSYRKNDWIEAVVNHDDNAVREYVDSWVKNPFVYKMGVYFDGNSIQMGSSPRFDMYGNEFGLGKGLAVLSGYANKFDGKITLYEGREGGGSMDLEVCLLPENMAAFETDEEFMSLVNGEINGFY